jgi:glycosyltransferase involved in cell wall biosynthesis
VPGLRVTSLLFVRKRADNHAVLFVTRYLKMPTRILSIVIPVRNQPETLDDLLTSLDGQQVPDGWAVEVVCVDNNSTDNTADVIRSHNTVYLLEPILGPSVARNSGAAASVGELLWFIDADAVPLGNDFIERLVQTAAELGDFGGFGGPILLPDAQRNNPVAFADHMACWSAWHQWRPTEISGFQPTSFVVRRSVFEEVGGYATDIRVLEDWDLQLRIEASRALSEGEGAPQRPIWFVNSLAVTHSARSSLTRTLKHSWYWGLPSRAGWLERSGLPVVRYERPFRRWLALPGLLWLRARHPVHVAWRTSRLRTLLSAPFLFLTLLVWAVAVIVGKGQPDADQLAPV